MEAVAAQASLAGALTLAWPKGPCLVVTAALEELGVQAVRQGQEQHGIHLFAATATTRQTIGAPVRTADRRALADAWTTGQTLSAE